MTDHDQDRKQLREIQAIFEDAVLNNTIGNIKTHIHPDFSFVSFSDSLFTNFEAFETQWKKTRAEMVGSGSFTTALNPLPADFHGDIAVTQGNSDNVLVNPKGKTFNYTSNWTVVFKRDGDNWKVLRAHNSLNPFDNPMLIDGVKSKVVQASIAAGLTGAIASFLVTKLL